MQEDISLKELTTMKVGGIARFFVSVQNTQEAHSAISWARKEGLPIFVLGGGSNVVISEEGFDGLVIKNEIPGISFFESGDEIRVAVGAGVNWDKLVETVAEKGLWGIENLSLIPGTVGAAPVQNIGAYGVEIKDSLYAVRAIDINTGESVGFTNEECRFDYRDSIFKQTKDFFISCIELTLTKKGKPNLSYKGLEEEAIYRGFQADRMTPEQVREVVIDIRKRKLPDPSLVPTAGSFFKNPEVTSERFKELKKRFPELPGFTLGGGNIKIPLAWIIENIVHMKGVAHGGAAVYEKHSLVLVNTNNASAKDIYELSQKVTLKVLESTGIMIEPEVQFIGDFN